MLKKPSKYQTTIVLENKSLAEIKRLEEDAKQERNWKRWGPYLSERQWAEKTILLMEIGKDTV